MIAGRMSYGKCRVNWLKSGEQLLFAHELYTAITLVVSAWVLLDMKYLQRWRQRKIRLELNGKWDELETHFQRRLRTRHLFVYLFQKYAMPGNVEASYALYLYNRGREDAALEFAERGIALARKQPAVLRSTFGTPTKKTLREALHTRALILNSLGRYDEARATSVESRTLPKVGGKTHVTESLTELYSGHLDSALRLVYETLAHDPKDGPSRFVASAIYCLKGEFAEAINILVYDLKDVVDLYSPEALANLLNDPEAAKFIALKRRSSAAVHKPARLLAIIRVYVDQQSFDDATQALDATEPILGTNPVIQANYHRYRAICVAAKGDAWQTEQHLAEARSLTQRHPKRDSQFETHIAAGRCYLSLKLTDKAGTEFLEAQHHTLHPIEKHVTNYWLARTAEAARGRTDAIRNYQSVIADDIPTVMRQESLAALNRLK